VAAVIATAEMGETLGGYRHEALLYSGGDGFAAATLPFIRAAVASHEPILVAVEAPKIDLLRHDLGSIASGVSFADMAEIGHNPALIISAWSAFVSEQADSGRPVRGIGEPVDAGRSPAALSECQLHESLLNLAFADETSFWLLCPYDTTTLATEVIDEARKSHPWVSDGVAVQRSKLFKRIDPSRPFDRRLPPAPDSAADMAFVPETFGKVREFVTDEARRAGLDSERAGALCLAVSELTTNSIHHGGGVGTVRAWSEDGFVVVEVADNGEIKAPLVGRLPPSTDLESGRGLWIVHQLCDLVQIQSSRASGTLVRVHMRL